MKKLLITTLLMLSLLIPSYVIAGPPVPIFHWDYAFSAIPAADDTYDLGSDTFEWQNLHVDGTANIDSLVADTADINGGTVDGVAIAGSTFKFKTIEKSADAVTLTAPECSGTLITNRGWDGADDQTFTLPDADTVVGAGLKFKLLAVVASGSTADTYIDTEGSTTLIYLNGVAGSNGDRIWFAEIAVGESITCHTATIDGTTYDWFCDQINGVVADKGN